MVLSSFEYCTYLAPPTEDERMQAARHPEVWER